MGFDRIGDNQYICTACGWRYASAKVPEWCVKCEGKAHVKNDRPLAAKSTRNPAKPNGPSTLPGSILHDLLSSYGFYETASCNCKSMAARMDRWGPDGCSAPENLKTIILWMVRQFRKRRRHRDGLSVTARAIVASTPKRFVPVLAKRMVLKAVRLSRKRLAEARAKATAKTTVSTPSNK